MVAAELSRTRAEHRWRMEAKVRAKAAKTPLPPPLSTSRIQLHSASMGGISCPVQVTQLDLLYMLMSWRITSSST